MLIFLCYAAAGLDINSCVPISCDLTLKSVCLGIYAGSVSVNECPAGYTCPGLASMLSTYLEYSNLTCVASQSNPVQCPTPWGTGFNPAGYQCCGATDCVSQQCQGNFCVGLSLGAQCTYDGECQPYSFCNGTCTQLLSIGSACKLDRECAVGSGCNLKLCTSFFSLNLGSRTNDAKFCASNFVFNGLCDNLIVSASPDLTKELNPPYACNLNSTCYYVLSFNGSLFSKDYCYCAGVPGPTGYCNLPFGVSEVDVTQRIVYNTTSCSGNLAHSTDPNELLICNSIMPFDQEFYIQVQQQRNFWPLFQSQVLQGCISNNTLFNPFDYGMSHSTFLTFALGISVFL